MMTQRDQLIAWLNDAYSMELGLIPVLKNHAKDAEEHPEVRDRDLQHAEETERHAEMVKECIESLDGSVSTLKAGLGSLSGLMNSVATGPFKDELVKNFLSDYAAEHFEIACYEALVVTAEECGEQHVADVCRQILQDEESMANWIEEHLPQAIRAHLGKQAMATAG